jgi:hypothetical protein
MKNQTNDKDFPGDDAYVAPEGQGIASDDPSQMSLYDGAGNETVVVVAENEEGRRAQGTGATADEALADARKGDSLLGKGFGTAH